MALVIAPFFFIRPLKYIQPVGEARGATLGRGKINFICNLNTSSEMKTNLLFVLLHFERWFTVQSVFWGKKFDKVHCWPIVIWGVKRRMKKLFRGDSLSECLCLCESHSRWQYSLGSLIDWISFPHLPSFFRPCEWTIEVTQYFRYTLTPCLLWTLQVKDLEQRNPVTKSNFASHNSQLTRSPMD